MNEHALPLADAPPPPVRVLHCPPAGTVALAVDTAAPLREALVSFIETTPGLATRLHGSTLRLSLGDRVPDPLVLRSLGQALRTDHGCTLVELHCSPAALRRFAETQLHLVVTPTGAALGAPDDARAPETDGAAEADPETTGPRLVAPADTLGQDTDADATVDAGDLPEAATAADAPLPFDDDDEDPDADWGDTDPAAAGDAPADDGPETVATTAAEATDESPVAESPVAEPPADETATVEAVPPVAEAATDTDAPAPVDPEGCETTSIDAPAAPTTVLAGPPAEDGATGDDAADDAGEARALPEGWNPEGRGRVTAIRRTLRSGNRVRAAGDLVVYGDVNAGAHVEATGNIIVLGALRGLAHAGSKGETDAVVLALGIDGGQVRIADQISFEAGAPSATGPRRRGALRLLLGRGAPAPVALSGPTLARLEGAAITIEPWRGRLPDLSGR